VKNLQSGGLKIKVPYERELPCYGKNVGLLRFRYMQVSMYNKFQGKVAKNVAVTGYPFPLLVFAVMTV
jgi:hypothetical protein